jgi:hypothetical protein
MINVNAEIGYTGGALNLRFGCAAYAGDGTQNLLVQTI